MTLNFRIPYRARRMLESIEPDIYQWWINYLTLRIKTGRCYVTLSLHRDFVPWHETEPMECVT